MRFWKPPKGSGTQVLKKKEEVARSGRGHRVQRRGYVEDLGSLGACKWPSVASVTKVEESGQ